MKCLPVIFIILTAIIATSLCDLSEDIEEWNDDNVNSNTMGSAYLENSEVGSKNIMSTVLNKILQSIIPNLKNISIANLSLGDIGSLSNVDVIIDNATANPVEGSGSFSIKNLSLSFDNIHLTGQYDIKSLPLPGPIIIFGTGDFLINLSDISFSTGITMKLNVSDLVITEFPDFNLSVAKSTLQFENLMGGGPVGDLLNSIISDALPMLIEAAQGKLIEEYGDDIAKALSPIINCIKGHITNPMSCFKLPYIEMS